MTNIIISQSPTKVNPISKWREHKLITREMAQRMSKAGLRARADRMAQCGAELDVSVCQDCGYVRINRANLCRDKLCPTCQWRLSIKRFADLYRVLQVLSDRNPEAVYSLCTLTARNCKLQDLGETIKVINQSVNRLFARPAIRKLITGWARSIEVTYNSRDNTWHPHTHIILSFKDETSQALLGDAILYAWLDVCPLITHIDAQEIHKIYADSKRTATTYDVQAQDNALLKAVCETFKYMTKVKSLITLPPKVLREYAVQVASKRQVSYGGLIASVRRELRMDDDLPEDRDGTEVCVNCGSSAVAEILLIWSGESADYIPLTN